MIEVDSDFHFITKINAVSSQVAVYSHNYPFGYVRHRAVYVFLFPIVIVGVSTN